MFTLKTGRNESYMPGRSNDPDLYNYNFSSIHEAEEHLRRNGYEPTLVNGRRAYRNDNAEESIAYIYNPSDGSCWR